MEPLESNDLLRLVCKKGWPTPGTACCTRSHHSAYECIFRSNLPLIPIANQLPIPIEIRQPFRCLCRLVVVIYTGLRTEEAQKSLTAWGEGERVPSQVVVMVSGCSYVYCHRSQFGRRTIWDNALLGITQPERALLLLVRSVVSGRPTGARRLP